ncbi:hypothetical protein [Streptomyces cyslabdanicus]
MTAPGRSGGEAGPPGFGSAGVTERLDDVQAGSRGGADAGLSVVGELP